MQNLDVSVTERRRQTRSRIFRYIYNSPEGCSKNDIARDLNLSLPTVYQNISELLDSGLISYGGHKGSSGGRPASVIQPVYNIRSAIGISVTASGLSYVSTDLSGEEINYKFVPWAPGLDVHAGLAFLLSNLESFIDESGIDRSSLIGVGITLPGIISGNTVVYAPTLGVDHFSLENFIASVPYRVHVENDATSGGIAEVYNCDEKRNVAFLSLSEGVGGSLTVGGEPYPGANNRSGEFGHMCVEYEGRPCTCGRRGCLEAYCSPKCLSDDLGLTLDEFFSRLEEGNPKCQDAWEQFGKYLAIGIHNLRMSFDSEIVLGGALSGYLEPCLSELRAKVAALDPYSVDATYLTISRYSKYSSMLGAALYFIKEFMDNI